MRVTKIALLLVVALGGCDRDKPGPASTAEFDQQWAALTKAAPEAAYIEDDHAAGMMGNVSRSPAEAPPSPPPPSAGGLPTKLDMAEISRTMRGNLGAVKVCYMREQRTTPRSGKAIVNFNIKGDGTVVDVNVVAPAFRGTNLPDCLKDKVKRITFPKFKEAPQEVSYPFVFMGN
jgi:hypothetical protein